MIFHRVESLIPLVERLDVHCADPPIALPQEVGNQMTTNEPPGATDDNQIVRICLHIICPSSRRRGPERSPSTSRRSWIQEVITSCRGRAHRGAVLPILKANAFAYVRRRTLDQRTMCTFGQAGRSDGEG